MKTNSNKKNRNSSQHHCLRCASLIDNVNKKFLQPSRGFWAVESHVVPQLTRVSLQGIKVQFWACKYNKIQMYRIIKQVLLRILLFTRYLTSHQWETGVWRLKWLLDSRVLIGILINSKKTRQIYSKIQQDRLSLAERTKLVIIVVSQESLRIRNRKAISRITSKI